jgi:hypothetical protein
MHRICGERENESQIGKKIGEKMRDGMSLIKISAENDYSGIVRATVIQGFNSFNDSPRPQPHTAGYCSLTHDKGGFCHSIPHIHYCHTLG